MRGLDPRIHGRHRSPPHLASRLRFRLNRLPAEIEAAILDHALAHPCHGPMRVAHELALRGIQVSSGGVRGVWSRHGPLTKHERRLRLEKASAERPVALSPEQIKLLERRSTPTCKATTTTVRTRAAA